ncbi:MAG: YopX family protein [Lachnospiraceae bacterium]|nr:YopX family protein [Lachnospiraceae bacterium]
MNNFSTMPLRFRAWDKEDEKLIYEAEKAYDYLRPDPYPILSDSFGDLIENDRYIISQDTGLKDKNGKSIYTGDILEDFNKAKIIVFFVNASFYGREMRTGNSYLLYNWWFDPYSPAHRGNYELPEVVGNIWEGPELLEEK